MSFIPESRGFGGAGTNQPVFPEAVYLIVYLLRRVGKAICSGPPPHHLCSDRASTTSSCLESSTRWCCSSAHWHKAANGQKEGAACEDKCAPGSLSPATLGRISSVLRKVEFQGDWTLMRERPCKDGAFTPHLVSTLPLRVQKRGSWSFKPVTLYLCNLQKPFICILVSCLN